MTSYADIGGLSWY